MWHNYLHYKLFFHIFIHSLIVLTQENDENGDESEIPAIIELLSSQEVNNLIVTEAFTTTDDRTALQTTVSPPTTPSSKCDSFSQKTCIDDPILNKIDLSSCHLETLQPHDLFKACTKVTFIDLSDNRLSTLHANIFESNTYIKHLNLSKNFLKEINSQWFKASSNYLTVLDLANNRLQNFPVDTLRKMTHLENLYLSGNEIHDVDEHKLMKKCERLELFEFHFNQIGCMRYKELTQFFQKNGTNVSMEEPRCINDGKWSALKLMKQGKVMKFNQKVKDDVDQLSFLMIVLSGVGFLLIGIIGSCNVFLLWNVWKIRYEGRYTNNFRFNADLGDYYEPRENEPDCISLRRESQPTSSGAIYAQVIKENKIEKEEKSD